MPVIQFSDYARHCRARDLKDGISLITAVKNREETLLQVLPTWLAHQEIDEIIIVDWSSDRSLEQVISSINDPRITLVSVRDQPRWVLTFAYNIGAGFVSRKKLVKVDADVKLLPGFFSKHPLDEAIFYTGNWETARNDNERHLNGVFYCNSSSFFQINGYNEFIKSYGWDDTDLYQRMKSIGLIKSDIDPDYLYHIEHRKRTRYQDHTSFIRALDDAERSVFNIMINYQLCSSIAPWSIKNATLEFECNRLDDHFVICRQLSEDKNVLPEEVMRECEHRAILQRLNHLGEELSPLVLKVLTQKEIREYYNLIFSKNSNDSDFNLYKLIRKMNSLVESES